MSRVPILHPGQSYTFRSYFELPFEPEDILAELGFTLKRSHLNLPRSNANLNLRLEESLPYISLSSIDRRDLAVWLPSARRALRELRS